MKDKNRYIDEDIRIKNYLIERFLIVIILVISVILLFLHIDRMEHKRITTQIEQVKDNVSGNTTHCRTLVVEGDWIYFIPDSGYGNLYKMKLDGSERQKLVDKTIDEFVLFENKIYYPFQDYDEEFGFIYSINIDGSDERQVTQIQCARYLNIVGDRIYYINYIYGDKWLYECNIHSTALDCSDQLTHNHDETLWFKVIDDIIYYISYGNNIGTYMLCSVKIDGSDLNVIADNLRISLGEYAQDIDIWGNTIYFSGIYSLKLDESSILKSVKTDGTNIANGRIYYTDSRNFYKADDINYYEDWVICSAKINSKGEYEDEKVLYTGIIDWGILDHYSYFIYIINDKLYFRSRAPNRSLYSMNLDGSDLWKIE